MSQKMPVVSSFDWRQLVPQLIAIAALVFVTRILFPHLSWFFAIFWGAVAYMSLCRIARTVLLREHLAGISDYRARRFAEAIAHFEASRAFFLRHRYVDSFRSVIFGVASPNPFRSVDLCNMAFCVSQLGEGQRAISLYEQVLAECPDYTLARASLDMLRSASPPSNDT